MRIAFNLDWRNFSMNGLEQQIITHFMHNYVWLIVVASLLSGVYAAWSHYHSFLATRYIYHSSFNKTTIYPSVQSTRRWSAIQHGIVVTIVTLSIFLILTAIFLPIFLYL